MKSACSCVVLIIIAFLPDLMYCQEIHLNELRRYDCTKMETNGLVAVATSFSYFFNAIVKLSKQLEDYTIIQFEIMRKNSKDYSFLFDVSIAYECSGLKLEANHQCKKIGDDIFNIDVSLRNESGDKIRGQIIHYNKTVLATDIKELSAANEAADSTGVFKINGQKMAGDMNCTRTIDVTALIVEFECSNPDTPCVMEVKVDDTIVINQNTDRAVFEEQVQSGRELLVEIKYAACSLKGKVSNLRCLVKMEFNETAIEGGFNVDNGIIISVAVSASVLIILIILLVIFLVIRKKRQKLKNNTNVIDKDKSHKSEDTVLSTVIESPEHPEAGEPLLGDDKEKTEAGELLLGDDKEKTEAGESLLGDDKEKTEAGEPLLGDDKVEQEQSETTKDEESTENTLDIDIFSAAKNGNVDIVQKFINTDPSCINDQDNEGYTALMHASKQGQENIAKLLIEKKANICIRNVKGMTALMNSCEKGHEGIEKMLIDRMVSIKGINMVYGSPQINVKEFINETNNDGMTPLILATRGGHENCVQLLIEYKADVDMKDNYGYTALLHECQYGCGLIAPSLIRGKADVNMKNPKGKTCLMLASEAGNEEIVKMLLKHEALIDERDDEGSTAMILASEKDHKKIVQLLSDYGASVNGTKKKARLT